MTEPTLGPVCQHVHELAAELALGLVTGRERAEALAHIEHCPACDAHLEQFVRVHDALRGLPPAHDPPAGFESRVLAGLPRPPDRQRRDHPDPRDHLERPDPPDQRDHPIQREQRDRPRVVPILVAAAVALALVAGGWAAGLNTTRPAIGPDQPAPQALHFVDLTGGGHRVGHAFAYPGPPAWVYLYLELEDVRPARPMSCLVQRTDGTRSVAGRFTISGEDAFWGGPVDVTTIDSVMVTDETGAVLATARFPARGR